MKKFIIIICLCCFILLPTTNTYAFSFFKNKHDKKQNTKQDIQAVELEISEKEKLTIEKSEQPKEIKDIELSKTDQEKIKAFEIQRSQDIEDIKSLWEGTLERNNVIKFALKKVTMNPQERKKHSSKMARTIAALVNGATLLPYMFGLDASIASAIAAGSSLGTQATKNKLGYGPQNIPVTDTELIQLASLIENLQNNLIKNYYSYKSAIELLKDCRGKLAVYKKNYNSALAQKNEANILVTKSMYEKQQIEELKLKNQIKTARIGLERYAGEEIVNNLNLVKVNELQAKTESNLGNL